MLELEKRFYVLYALPCMHTDGCPTHGGMAALLSSFGMGRNVPLMDVTASKKENSLSNAALCRSLNESIIL